MKTNTVTTIVLAGILAFSLAACSKSEAPTTKKSERTEPPKPPAQQQPTVPTLHQEAVALAEKGLLETWTQFGDSWFTLYNYTSDGKIFSDFFQAKTVTHDVRPQDLSEAETLNGLQWNGLVALHSRIYRKYEQVKDSPQVPQWSEWANGSPMLWNGDDLLPSYMFKKKNGQWTISYVYMKEYVKRQLTKPTEEQIKKILSQ